MSKLRERAREMAVAVLAQEATSAVNAITDALLRFAAEALTEEADDDMCIAARKLTGIGTNAAYHVFSAMASERAKDLV